MLTFDLHVRPLKKDTFILIAKIKEPELCERLCRDIDEGIKKNHNNYKTNVKGKMTSFTYFNKNKNFIDFLEITRAYFQRVTYIFTKTIYCHDLGLKDAWGNLLEDKDQVMIHTHMPDLLSGILYLSDGVGTSFPQYNKTISAEVGKFVLFDSMVEHQVHQINSISKRYSISFNFGPVNKR